MRGSAVGERFGLEDFLYVGVWCRTEDELAEQLQRHRAGGKTVVSTNGCFDILNLAHLRMLQEAADQGDILVVGVNSDHSIKGLKGAGRPIRPEEERVQLVAALDRVDYAILFDEHDCSSFVRRVSPDVHVNDASYGEDCVEAEAVREGGGRLHLIDKFEWESNSELLDRIRSGQ